MTDEELVAKYQRVAAQRIYGRGEAASHARYARQKTLRSLRQELRQRGLYEPTKCNVWIGEAA